MSGRWPFAALLAMLAGIVTLARIVAASPAATVTVGGRLTNQSLSLADRLNVSTANPLSPFPTLLLNGPGRHQPDKLLFQ